MRNQKITRLLALFLAVVMVIGYIPTYAFATETEETQETTAAFVEETEAATEAEETETATEAATEESTEASEEATEEATEAATEEATEETTQPEEEYDFPDVDSMTDAELLAYYAGLSDEEAEAFALSLTDKQLERLSDLLYAVELCGESSDTHTVFKNTQSTLAPGVTQNIKYAYAADGKQMVYYIATADVSRDDVVVQTSYYKQHEDGVLGMAKLTEQIAYANAKYTNKEDALYISDYYNVVAGVNSSFYNMTTGQPMGITFIDGVSFGTNSYDNFFAILKDGKTAVIDYASNLGKYVDNNGESTIWQAAAGSAWLVRDGKDVTANVTGSYNTDRHSRTCVGITADGKVVLMVLDGRQEPFSCGGSFHELAQIMLEAGCVAAINLDGGGSTTFASKAEGANAVSVINRPSDGTERSISAGIIIASTTVPSNVFDHVSMVAADEYVTPGTSTEVTVTGVSPVGGAADIPEGITYEVANGTYENGVLTAGEAGDVTLTAKYNGVAVGSVTIHSVIPTEITFNVGERTVSYGNTIDFTITATTDDGLHQVKYQDGDIVLTMDDEKLGTINGLSYTAADETSGLTGGVITAKLVASESVCDTVAITLTNAPDEPVIYEDFEDMPEYRFEYSQWYFTVRGEYKIVDKTTGQVHSGDHALAVTTELRGANLNSYFGNVHIGAKNAILSNTGKYDKVIGTKTFEDLDLTNAKSLGMWIYIPEDSPLHYVQFRLTNKENSKLELQYKLYDYGYSTTESGHTGWQYFELDFDEVNTADVTYNDGSFYLSRIDIYACTRNDTANQSNYGYNRDNQQSVQGPITFYFDDITVEYIDTGMDNDDPTFDYVRASYGGMSDGVTLNGQTITSNVVSVTARASDAGVGIDPSSAKAYVDGVAVTSGFRCDELGIMTIDDVTLADGTHTFTFVISDKNGNCDYVTRQLTINAGSDIPTASLKLAEELTDRPLFGQVIWMNLEVDNIENVNTISTRLNLNLGAKWELDHMVVAEGFQASYTIDSITNDAIITVKRVGNTKLSGHDVAVQIPIRMYYADPLVDSTDDPLSSQTVVPEDIKLSMDVGLVSYKDGTSSTFSMTKLDIDSEIYSWYDVRKANGDIVSGYVAHIHTANAMEDKAATCTESGYTGRTYCEVCDSVVDWGTTIPATGHTYEITDGVLKCHCDETFTGTWTDGKEYVDGVAQADGWVGDSYYLDGTKVTGIHKVPAADGSGEFYYDFGEDGISTGKYTGLFLDETEQVYRYAKIGELVAGWVMIDDNWHYFHGGTYAASAGTYKVGDVKYEFDETGKIATGVWARTLGGTRYYYGPTYYQKGWQTIDGNRYFFQNGYRYEGKRIVHESNNTDLTWYDFGTDGICRDMTDGLYRNEDGLYYILNGLGRRGLWKIDGAYYFFRYNGTAVTGSVYAYETHCDLKCDTYYFGQDCKMVNGIVETEDGIYCYINGKKASAGLTKLGDDYYFVGSDAKCATGTKYAWATNCDLPCDTYEFGADGKMLNGIVEKADGVYYYTNGKVDGSSVGLNKIGDDYYFIGSNGKCAVGVKYAWKTNCDLKCDTYEFGADGKMCSGIVMKEDGPYYYTNGKGGVEVVGLNKVGEDYYFISYGGKCSVGSKYAWATNCDLPCNTYEFGADGKMLRGLVQKDDGLYYYVNGRIDGNAAGLTKIGEDYYFIGSNGKCATGTKYAWATNCDLPCTTYEFGADGKMLQGIVEKSNGIYYYINGQTGRQQVGLIRVGEDYYFVNSDGKCATGTKYAWETSCDLPCDTYEFGADGKMLQGLVEKDGNLYLYVNGKLGGDRAGLTKLGEDYYFIGSSGQCATGTKYAWKTNCDLPCDTYEFGTDGKMLRGFITRENGIYYYDNGKLAQTGLHFIDGYYYCVKSDGTLVVSQSYYVWQTNDLLIEDTYTFNEYGQIIG